MAILNWLEFWKNQQNLQQAKDNAGVQPTINPDYGEPAEKIYEPDDENLKTASNGSLYGEGQNRVSVKNPNDTTSRYMPLTSEQAYYNPETARFITSENAKAAQGTQDASLVAPYLTNTDFNSIPNNVKSLLTGGSSTAAAALGAENNIAAMKYGLPVQNAQTELAQSYRAGSAAQAANRLAIPQDQATAESQALRGDIVRNPLVQSTLNNNAINSNFAATAITPYELKVAAIQAQGRLGTAPSEEEIRKQVISNRALQTKTEGIYAQGASDLAPLAVNNQRLAAVNEARGLTYRTPPTNRYSVTSDNKVVQTPGWIPGMTEKMGSSMGDLAGPSGQYNTSSNPTFASVGNGLHLPISGSMPVSNTNDNAQVTRPLRVAPTTTSSISQPSQVVTPSITKSNLQQDDDIIGHLPDGTPIYKNGSLGHWFKQQFQNGPAMGGSQ